MTRRLQQLVALCLLCTTGCALFSLKRSELLAMKSPLNAEQVADFESDVPTRNIVRLETSVMSATSAVKRIRDLVWEELDEIGPMSPEDRQRLNQSGIRVGVSGGALPWALESLRRGDRADLNHRSSNPASGQNTSFGSQIAISEGSRSVIELPTAGKNLIVPASQIARINNGRELTDARCVVELTPIEYGNGWVVIRFLPQIYHGATTTRYSMAANGEQMPVRQKIHPLYEQQFELKLHANETVVIGHLEQKEWTVGRMLFQSELLTSRSERLIAIQLRDIEKVSGQKSLEVSYSKY